MRRDENMSKRFVTVSLILCLCLVFGMLTSAVGSQITTQGLEKLQEIYENQSPSIKQYDIDAAKQKASAELTAAQKNFSVSVMEQKREIKLAQEKYQLQKDYYNLYQLIKAKEIAEINVDIAAMNLTAEIEKLSQGLGTEASVMSAKISKKQSEISLEDAILNVEKAETALKEKLGLDPESELSVEYALPSSVDIVTSYKQDDFVNSFLSNNIELATLKNDIKLQKEYIEKLEAVCEKDDPDLVNARRSLTLLEEQLKNTEKDYTAYAKGVYRDYMKVAELLKLQMEYKPLLDNKVLLLDKEYAQKKYSTLEYNQRKVSIMNEYRSFESAVINYLNAKAMLELVMKGIKI